MIVVLKLMRISRALAIALVYLSPDTVAVVTVRR